MPYCASIRDWLGLFMYVQMHVIGSSTSFSYISSKELFIACSFRILKAPKALSDLDHLVKYVFFIVF